MHPKQQTAKRKHRNPNDERLADQTHLAPHARSLAQGIAQTLANL